MKESVLLERVGGASRRFGGWVSLGQPDEHLSVSKRIAEAASAIICRCCLLGLNGDACIALWAHSR